jgi:hypothetical protein
MGWKFVTSSLAEAKIFLPEMKITTIGELRCLAGTIADIELQPDVR